MPAGDALVDAGTLTWPSGHQKTVTGLDLALKHYTTIDAAGLSVRVATAAVLVLLKMIAFLDRPSDRERDLEDIAHTVHQYAADDDRRWVLEPLGGRDWDDQSAWLLGLDVQRIAQARHRDLALDFLEQLIERKYSP